LKGEDTVAKRAQTKPPVAAEERKP
jgi:hypothetical protein